MTKKTSYKIKYLIVASASRLEEPSENIPIPAFGELPEEATQTDTPPPLWITLKQEALQWILDNVLSVKLS